MDKKSGQYNFRLAKVPGRGTEGTQIKMSDQVASKRSETASVGTDEENQGKIGRAHV